MTTPMLNEYAKKIINFYQGATDDQVKNLMSSTESDLDLTQIINNKKLLIDSWGDPANIIIFNTTQKENIYDTYKLSEATPNTVNNMTAYFMDECPVDAALMAFAGPEYLTVIMFNI